MKKIYSGLNNALIVEVKMPKWLQQAKRNRIARIKRFAKKYGVSFDKADAMLQEITENNAQSNE